MNVLFLLMYLSVCWFVLGLLLFALIFNGELPDTTRQKIVFMCFIGPIGCIVGIINWVFGRFKKYYWNEP